MAPSGAGGDDPPSDGPPRDPLLQSALARIDCAVYIVLDATYARYPVVLGSDEFCKQMCYAPHEIEGKPFDFMFGPDTNAEGVTSLNLALNDAREEDIRLLCYDGNGYPFINVMSVVPVRVAFGDVKYFVLVMKDVDATRSGVGAAQRLTAFQMWRRKQVTFKEYVKSVPRSIKAALLCKSTRRRGSSSVRPLPSNSNLVRVLSMAEADEGGSAGLGDSALYGALPPLILHPNGTLKVLWDWLVLMMVVYTSVTVPYQAAFDQSVSEGISIFSDVVFWLDIVVNMRTALTVDGQLVTDWRAILRVYARSWLIVDFISSMPFEYILANQGNGELFQLLKSLRLLRLGKVVRKLDRFGTSGAFQIFYLMLGFALLDHWLACGWYAVGDNIDDPRTWLKLLPSGDRTSDYVNSLYFTTYTMTTVGYGNIAPSTQAEKIYSIFIMLIGAVAYASIFGNMASIIQRAYLSTSKYQQTINSMREFIRFHRIPPTLQRRILSYAQHSWQMTRGIDMNAMLDSFPEALRADVSMHLHQPLVANSPLFKNASKGCMRSIALKLRTTFSAPGDCLIHQGDAIDTLFFIAHGNMEIVVNEKRVAVLTDGDFFGEMSLGERSLGKANATVRALTFCDLHSILHIDLLDIMHRYPEFMPEFKKNLHYSYALRAKKQTAKEAALARSAAVAAAAAAAAAAATQPGATTNADDGGPIQEVDIEMAPLAKAPAPPVGASSVLRRQQSWNGSTVDFSSWKLDNDGGEEVSPEPSEAGDEDPAAAADEHEDAAHAHPAPVEDRFDATRPAIPQISRLKGVPADRRVSMGSAPSLGAVLREEHDRPLVTAPSGEFQLRPQFQRLLGAPSGTSSASSGPGSSRGLFIRKPVVQHTLESGILSRMDAHEQKMAKHLTETEERLARMEASVERLMRDVGVLVNHLQRQSDAGSLGRQSTESGPGRPSNDKD